MLLVMLFMRIDNFLGFSLSFQISDFSLFLSKQLLISFLLLLLNFLNLHTFNEFKVLLVFLQSFVHRVL